MRYVSEQFKEKQNQLIRPTLKMYFEICSDVTHGVFASQILNFPVFDTTAAPVVLPKDNTNKYYYAVVGDGISVDDPNRMCAPDNSGVIATPTHSVPIGITTVIPANTEALFGSNTLSDNLLGLSSPITFNFKGELIPEQIRVQRYVQADSSWVEETTIYNSELSNEITYTPATPYVSGYRRFYFLNSTKSGRYQVNWLRRELAMQNGLTPITFGNNCISSVVIDEETDLTSQAEPRYDMTVTCLDVNGEYSPESDYWKRDKQFSDGQICYLSAGYKNSEGVVELLSIIEGNLIQKPTYDQGRITFKISAWAMNTLGYGGIASLPDSTLNVGDEIVNRKISSIYSVTTLYFTNVNIFHSLTDDDNSITNYYGYDTVGNIRKQIANALGGYIMVSPNDIGLFNTCDIQYKSPVDYLTRYEQEKCTLDSQPKVKTISVARNENTLSADYVDIEAVERVSIAAYGGKTTKYILPFFAFGKATVVDYQSSVPGTTLTMGSITQNTSSSGEVTVNVLINNSGTATTVKPIVRFYRVNTSTFEDTETVDSNATESYINDNNLVTNSYVADKVKRVARFMSDVSNQYEVDVIQDLRYELGDVIRLETEKNVFKTCVITALKFNLPGSKGHVTCRKIFSLMDSAYAVPDPQGSLYVNFPTGGYYYVGKNDGMAIFGTFTYSNRCFFYGLGFSTFTKTPYGAELSINKKLVDLNGHEWGVFFYNVDSSYTTNNPRVIELPDYDSSSGANANSWGAIELIKALYKEQNMTPPVDYTCTLVNP